MYNQHLLKLGHVIIICALFMRAFISAKYDCIFESRKLIVIENDYRCWYREQGLRYFCIFRRFQNLMYLNVKYINFY